MSGAQAKAVEIAGGIGLIAEWTTHVLKPVMNRDGLPEYRKTSMKSLNG